jgi:Mg-chelatase subunit ChlD
LIPSQNPVTPQLAEHLGCECYTLSELKAEALYYAVKEELKG